MVVHLKGWATFFVRFFSVGSSVYRGTITLNPFSRISKVGTGVNLVFTCFTPMHDING